MTRRFGLLPIAFRHVRALDADFAALAELHLALGVGDVDEFHLRSGVGHAAGGGPPLALAGGERPDRRGLGHAPAFIQLAAGHLLEPLLHHDRQRRAAGAAETQRGKIHAFDARDAEQGDMHGRHAQIDGDLLLDDGLERGLGIEARMNDKLRPQSRAKEHDHGQRIDVEQRQDA